MSLTEQKRRICARFDGVQTWSKAQDGVTYLCFDLNLRPAPTAAMYRVFFAYAEEERPLVLVYHPEPRREVNGRLTPHLNGDGTLCLFDATGREWTPADAIAETIVPWTIRWLFHYEHWIAFGEWRGDAAPQNARLKTNERPINRNDFL